MKCNFIHIKKKDKKDINLNDNKTLQLFKLSFGNSITNLNYIENKKKYSSQNLVINHYKKYLKKNIGKMIYANFENNKEIKILDNIFILNNKKRAKIIINNKLNELQENIEDEKQIFKIKIKFLDIIINLQSIFEKCKTLYSIHNFQNINTKYLKNIDS